MYVHVLNNYYENYSVFKMMRMHVFLERENLIDFQYTTGLSY